MPYPTDNPLDGRGAAMDESALRSIVADLTAGERAVLMQLSHNRPTEDGDIIGKQARDSLIRRGLAYRSFGVTSLTRDGIAAQAIAAGDAAIKKDR